MIPCLALIGKMAPHTYFLFYQGGGAKTRRGKSNWCFSFWSWPRIRRAGFSRPNTKGAIGEIERRGKKKVVTRLKFSKSAVTKVQILYLREVARGESVITERLYTDGKHDL